MKATKKTHTVLKPFRHGHRPVAAGTEIDLTDKQAKYLILSGQIEPKNGGEKKQKP